MLGDDTLRHNLARVLKTTASPRSRRSCHRRCQQPPSCNGDYRGMLGSRDQVAVTGNIGSCRAFRHAAIHAPIGVADSGRRAWRSSRRPSNRDLGTRDQAGDKKTAPAGGGNVAR
jgi:hypothetical protein